LSLLSFQPFSDTADALSAATAVLEGKVHKSLKSFLKKQLKKTTDSLAVADKTLGISLKETLSSSKGVTIAHDTKTAELFRGLRCYMDELFDAETAGVAGVSSEALRAMQLGLSHSLGRYKLKFSADKVDTMVIQAVGLLDELDKEINTYAMRVKEWYGWHFPELQAMLADNVQYSMLVLECGMRPNYAKTDLSQILQDESTEAAVKEAAEVSMGTEIAELDILNIRALAEQVLSLMEYRKQLFTYLQNRMNAIAPNLSILVGELVGARLISHAGSLMNLAKQPASTIQILGAEKALFRALKTKHATPKYGLIYHASLIGQATPKHKGKISRVLAAKAALGIRVDALSDETADQLDTTVGLEGRAKVEARLRQLEGGGVVPASAAGSHLKSSKTAKYDPVAAKTASASAKYNDASDMQMTTTDKGGDDSDDDGKKKKKKKEKRKSKGGDEEDGNGNGNGETPSKKAKKKKKDKKRKADEVEDDSDDKEEKKSAKKDKKKRKST
jgi:nucleolar protein 58